jgi:hypothetical protein
LVLLVEAVVVYGLLAARLDPRFRLRPRGVGKRDGADVQQGTVTWYERLRDDINTEAEVFGDSD